MKTTTEQLQELLSVAEKAIEDDDRLLFNEEFNPTTCADLVRRLIRAEKMLIDLCVSDRSEENI